MKFSKTNWNENKLCSIPKFQQLQAGRGSIMRESWYIMEDYIDYIMDELHQEGQELGLEGKELNDYIEDQFEQRGYY